MRPTFTSLSLLSKLCLVPLVVASVVASCGDVPSETAPPPLGQELQPAGVMQGTVVYTGPHPCSKNGHIVGEAVLLVFDRRVLPPPTGLAQAPVNFAIVTGDDLFTNEPRNPGTGMYCPNEHGVTDNITVSAPFTIAPFAGGEYIIDAFYDYTGDFLPNFKFSLFPEMGDISGGYIDPTDPQKPVNVGNINYHPPYLPVDVGTPLPLDAGPYVTIPNFVIPDTGVVVGNITVTLDATVQTRRPYFYPAGMSASFDPSTKKIVATETQSSAAPPKPPKPPFNNLAHTVETDPNFAPILTIPQDLQALAGPNNSMDQPSVDNFEASLPRIVLHWSLPKAEYPTAIAPPFHFQVPPPSTGGFTVWQNAVFDPAKQKWTAQDIPEGGGVPDIWPLVVLTKLIDDPGHLIDPSSVKTQAGVGAPVVILEGITLLAGDGVDQTKPDSLFNTGQSEAFGNLFDPVMGQPVVFTQDHITAVIRPAAICFNTLYDATNPDKRGTLILPHLTGMTSDITNPTPGKIFNESSLMNPTNEALVDATKTTQACFPTGRYAINVVYPNGQVWSVPNEAGACAPSEGPTNYPKLSCSVEPRPILYSQGTRGVVEITKTTNPAHCVGADAPPPACSLTPQ